MIIKYLWIAQLVLARLCMHRFDRDLVRAVGHIDRLRKKQQCCTSAQVWCFYSAQPFKAYAGVLHCYETRCDETIEGKNKDYELAFGLSLNFY